MRLPSILLVALLAGCLRTSVEAPVPPSGYEGVGPPPVPPGAADAGGPEARTRGGCVVDSAFAWPRMGARFTLPVDAAFARAHAESWSRANVTLWMEADRRVAFQGAPAALEGNLTFTLAQRGDEDFALDLRPGAYVAWSLGVDVSSDDPALASLQPLGTPALHGWLLVTRGSDDKLWVYLEGVRLAEGPFPVARILGGDLFVSGHGICA